MATPIERYIQSNQDTVNRWLTKLFGYYSKELIYSPDDVITISSKDICNDARRTGKLLDVLRHFGLMEACGYRAGARHYGYSSRYDKDYYEIVVDHKAFRKMARKFGSLEKFEYKAPKESINQEDTYPELKNVDHETAIYFYFNQKKFEVIDREEIRMNYRSSKMEPTRVVRLFPKSLQSQAEKAVYQQALENYLEENMDEALRLVYGFEPQALCSEEELRWSSQKEETLKNMGVERCNRIALTVVDREQLQERLEKARKLKEYAEACISDLEQIAGRFPKNNDTFQKRVFKEAEKKLLVEAPLLLTSGRPGAAELAQCLLKGSNKGIR